jgi:hypothetical protein
LHCTALRALRAAARSLLQATLRHERLFGTFAGATDPATNFTREPPMPGHEIGKGSDLARRFDHSYTGNPSMHITHDRHHINSLDEYERKGFDTHTAKHDGLTEET